MLLQQSPFRGEDEDEIYDAILADEPLYPIHMPRDSVSILQKLLTREPDQRLGSGPTDAQEVMSQPFFRNINWDDIYHKRVAPPFMPQIKTATDTSNFDSEFTSVTPVLTPVQSGKSCCLEYFRLLYANSFDQFCHKPCKRSSEDSPIQLILSKRLHMRLTILQCFIETMEPRWGYCLVYRIPWSDRKIDGRTPRADDVGAANPARASG